MPPRACIFDLDGTLVDSLTDIANAMNRCLVRAGLPVHQIAAYRALVGEGVEALVRKAAPPGYAIDALLADMRRDYAQAICVETRPFPGIEPALAALRQKNIPLAVLSNKPHRLTGELVDRLFTPGMFEAVIGHRDQVPRKPDPTSALALAKTLGVPPVDILFIGDTPIDMLAARNAGMIPVGVPWGFRDRQQLLDAGALEVIDDPVRLLTLVG